MLSMRSITTCKSDLFAGQYSKVKKLQDPSQCHAVHEVHVTPDSKFDSSRLSQLMASATRALADTWPSNFLISIGKPDTTRVEQHCRRVQIRSYVGVSLGAIPAE